MAFDEPDVRLLFPVPFVTVRLKNAAALNLRLLAEIADRRAAEPGIGRSNRNGELLPIMGPSVRCRRYPSRS